MNERIFEYEYRPGEELVLRLRPPKIQILPPEAREHFRAARRELLLALRSLLDSAIEALEKREKKGPKARTKIKVE